MEGDSPVPAARVLRWMAQHGQRLRELTELQETLGHPVRVPADDGVIRANLVFLAEALTAAADPGLATRLLGFADALDTWFDQEADELEAHLLRAEGAIALEEHLQFGTVPGRDPSLDAALERRLRVMGWLRLFVHGLEASLGPQADGLADATLAWIAAHQRELSRLVLTLDAHARSAHAATGQLTPELLDEIGQTAAVRASVRQLAEALEETLGATT